MLNSVLTTDAGLASVTALQFMECTLASIVLGVFCAIIYMYRNRYNKSFVVTLDAADCTTGDHAGQRKFGRWRGCHGRLQSGQIQIYSRNSEGHRQYLLRHGGRAGHRYGIPCSGLGIPGLLLYRQRDTQYE